MKILIFGGSGTGKTTLGMEISKRTSFVHLDSDTYYWRESEIPFTEKVPLAERNKNITIDFEKYENVVISGSMLTWGAEWKTAFDLAIFIYLDKNERMQRLKKRELERYGEKLLNNEKIQQHSREFLEWANQYENPNFDGRTLQVHKQWIDLLDCKVLEIDGSAGLDKKMERILAELKRMN